MHNANVFYHIISFSPEKNQLKVTNDILLIKYAPNMTVKVI
jgi:hypothetical protein